MIDRALEVSEKMKKKKKAVVLYIIAVVAGICLGSLLLWFLAVVRF
jgi:hypothetical protein